MNAREILLPLPQGRFATLAVPEPLTAEAIEALQRGTPAILAGLRQSLDQRRDRDAGAAEYDSWLALLSQARR